MINAKGEVYVYNKTQEGFVATEVAVANTYLRRLIGLIGMTKKWVKPGHGLWIVPSRGIHTIGMMFPIDLIFLDQSRRVIHLEEHVRPFVISRLCLSASSVLELPPHTIFRTGTRVGDLLEISTHRPNAKAEGVRRESQAEFTSDGGPSL